MPFDKPGPGRPVGLAKTGGRQKGTPNRATAEMVASTKEFFRRILDDEVEEKFWRYFITGYETHELEDGRMQIIPIPLNPVAFQAFKRAVEYKRGLPVQPVADVTDQLEFGAMRFAETQDRDSASAEARKPS